MKMNYTHITEAERYQIYALKKAGISQSKIALQLNRNPSTISRELRRNKGLKGYRPKQAQLKAVTRNSMNAYKIPDETWQLVKVKLHEEWSPEQIGQYVSICHEAIYQWVYRDKAKGGDLWQRLGDWEADTIIGIRHKQAIESLVERKSGFTLIQKVERKTSEAVSQAMMALLKPFENRVLTITSDNGREFAGQEKDLALKLLMKYFMK